MRGVREIKIVKAPSSEIREPVSPKLAQTAGSSIVNLNSSWSGRAEQPRGIARVPTHTVGRIRERRNYVRARLSLPLLVQRIAGQRDIATLPLETRDISSSGVFFLCPRHIDPGTPVELEVQLVNRPYGRGTVHMCAVAHVVRADEDPTNGMFGLAVAFDDITYRRDDSLPHPQQKPS